MFTKVFHRSTHMEHIAHFPSPLKAYRAVSHKFSIPLKRFGARSDVLIPLKTHGAVFP